MLPTLSVPSATCFASVHTVNVWDQKQLDPDTAHKHLIESPRVKEIFSEHYAAAKQEEDNVDYFGLSVDGHDSRH